MHTHRFCYITSYILLPIAAETQIFYQRVTNYNLIDIGTKDYTCFVWYEGLAKDLQRLPHTFTVFLCDVDYRLLRSKQEFGRSAMFLAESISKNITIFIFLNFSNCTMDRTRKTLFFLRLYGIRQKT